MNYIQKYAPYIIAFILLVTAFKIGTDYVTRRALKSDKNDLTNEINIINAGLEVSALRTRELTLKNIELLDSVSVIGGLLTNSYADRKRESEYYQHKLNQIPKLTAVQIDSAIEARYPDVELRDVQILIDVTKGDQCKIELTFADNQIELLEKRNIRQNKVIQNQAEIIRNKDADNGLFRTQIGKLNELVAAQDKQLKQAKWKTRGIIVGGIIILILTNI